MKITQKLFCKWNFASDIEEQIQVALETWRFSVYLGGFKHAVTLAQPQRNIHFNHLISLIQFYAELRKIFLDQKGRKREN